MAAPLTLVSVACSETGPAGYTNKVSLTNIIAKSVNANLDPGEQPTCTFTVAEVS